ncbi:hypothetical protein MBAV_006098 [Candidatus Magnetobacterium bavaricum]|uniref:Uncharacterized protein n=1 Tax=Candidatus Magnetobacterium bavaricum TaxID=29290 RepID=A0A0F3GIE2_9BACT|nr:hypothetical protein MBAV_006098 [Candidatus Magnetobacterium bavaricum]
MLPALTTHNSQLTTHNSQLSLLHLIYFVNTVILAGFLWTCEGCVAVTMPERLDRRR